MTLNDFIMESAIVETTNDTAVSDIQMEQWNAEINVGMAMLNCMEKYAMLSEYATCDIDEFFEEGAKLNAKIDSVDEWKNSGGKVKKVLGTIGSGILKALRAVANFFKNLFSKDKNPFAKAKKLIDGGYDGKTVTFGIRPEDVYDSEMYIETSPASVFESVVKVYELMGAEVFLYFDLEEFPITARVDPRTNARPGDNIRFAIDIEKIHVFDKETEKVITN